jgi:RNA polymerase sigma factor (sigma-70 family)
MDNNLDNKGLGFALGIKKSIYNNEIRKRRLALGMNMQEFANACGISVWILSKFESFKRYPKVRDNNMRGYKFVWLNAGEKLANYLHVPFEVLFPKWLSAFEIERSTIEIEQIVTPQSLNSPEVLMLTDSIESIENSIDKDSLRKEVAEVLKTLNSRERSILELKFGLNGDKPKTLEEVGKTFQVTRERVRQIEAKAIRRLQHPTRARKLKEFIG